MPTFEKYTPRTAALAVKLDSNEHAYGLPPALQEELLARIRQQDLSRYPDARQAGLRRRLAAYTGQPEDQIVVGNGGDELLQLLACAFRQRCRAVVTTPPTFVFYRLVAQLVGLDEVRVPLKADFAFDEPGLLEVMEGRSWPQEVASGWDQGGDELLYFICSPNNPTGNVCPPGTIERLLERGAWVVLDEAYGEFAGTSAAPLLQRYPRLIILRTMSKAFALAGARVGYLLAAPGVADVIDALRQPYNISRFGQVAGETVLDHLDQMRSLWEQITRSREELYQALDAIPGVTPYRSQANFILFRVDDGDAEGVWLALRDHDVSIRNMTAKPGLEQHLRVTVGSEEDNQTFLTALRTVLGQGRQGSGS